MEFHHVSVLLEECIKNLQIKENGIYVDGTLGGGGHSLEICKRLTSGRLIAIDQDLNAHQAAKEKLKDHLNKVTFVHDNFVHLKQIVQELGIPGIDGILLDIGVSSHQLDEAQRGFSYMQDAPLDMRMDLHGPLSAWEVVNHYSMEKLNNIIFEYGEERWAKRIAQFIVEARQNKSIDTTAELVEIIKKAVPKAARKDGPHPAKRTFQAIRIEVNQELDVLRSVIADAAEVLNPAGRLCIITFHSLEDRIVKNEYRRQENPCTCPIEFPVCVCGKQATSRIITRKPILPSEMELEINPRARSAKLRVLERIST